MESLRIQAVQAAVEDDKSEADLLAVYNVDIKAAPALILPMGALFAIKEPYYKIAASGGYLIRLLDIASTGLVINVQAEGVAPPASH